MISFQAVPKIIILEDVKDNHNKVIIPKNINILAMILPNKTKVKILHDVVDPNGIRIMMKGSKITVNTGLLYVKDTKTNSVLIYNAKSFKFFQKNHYFKIRN